MPETITSERYQGNEASEYHRDYQPEYPNPSALADVIAELEATCPVVDSHEIDRVRGHYAKIAIGEDPRMVLVTGPCSETASITRDFDITTSRYLELLRIGDGFRVHHTLRACGQSAKPRSQEYEDDGTPSYYGDMINSIDIDEREPDPYRMLEVQDQAKVVRKQLESVRGQTVTISHEALLLPYEKSSLITIEGKDYLTSCHVPWIGKRTNDPTGEHVKMLERIHNPIGVKIGPGDTPEKIIELSQKLNPEDIPGKLLFILRFGVDHVHEAPKLIIAIRENAPRSIILSDPMHGNTVKTADGRKTRELPVIIQEIHTISAICDSQGMRLHGLHLEASGRNDREECVDRIGGTPKHSSVVDPELNNDQLRHVLEATRMCFVDKKRIGKLVTSADGTIDLNNVLV